MKTISTQTPPAIPADASHKKAQFATEEAFNPEIFSARRIKVAPVVCLFGYLFMVYAILKKPKSPKED